MHRRLCLAILLAVLLLPAGCGQGPAGPAGGETLPPTPAAYPPPPTVATIPPATAAPTRTPVPLPTATPIPTPIQPTPYAPKEALPADLPTVVYAVQRPGQPAQLWTLHYEQGLLQEEMLLDLSPEAFESRIDDKRMSFIGYGWVSRLAFSPDGRYLAINLESYETVGTTVIIRLADGKVYLPPPPVEGDVAGFLAWIPGSERFVWKGGFGANWGTTAIDGSAPTGFPISDVLDAVVSLDGRKVLFSTIPSADVWLGTIDTDGNHLTPYPVTKPLISQRARNLKLSPDGLNCAFTWDREVTYRGAGQIWLMDTDGANQRPLGPANSYDFDPAWSPDGRTIAFVRWDNHMPREQVQGDNPTAQKSSLWVVDVQTGKEYLLLSSEGKYAHWAPAWLPDGSGLVFLSDWGGEANLWFVRPDGIGLQQLTRQGGLVGEVAVFPRPK